MNSAGIRIWLAVLLATALGRQARASLQVGVERLAVRFGKRQPEESAELQRPRRVFFCQLTGAQELGAEGRQPNCELTESMPAARLSIWIMLTSSGVIGGLVDSASIAIAGAINSGTGSLSLAFLMRRAVRNQSNMVS